MTEIKATIFRDAEAWLRENVPDFTGDTVCAVRPVSRFDADGFTKYEDVEEGSSRKRSLSAHVDALKMLCEMIDGKKLFVGNLDAAIQLTDAGNWDIEVVDAFWQLVYHREVIYG